MNCLALAALMLVGVGVVSAKSCADASDCDKDQCCAGFTPFRGSCKPMTKEKSKCLVDERVFPFNDIHIMSCPCEEGLECVGKEDSKGNVKNEGKCQVPVTTVEAETTTKADSGEETATTDSSNGSSEEKPTEQPDSGEE